MFKGSMPALVTPFQGGELDLETLKKLVEWHIGEGSHGLVPVGTTGESPTLSHDEHDRVISEAVQAAAGRIKVMAGTGSNSTDEAVRLTSWAAASSVRRVLSAWTSPALSSAAALSCRSSVSSVSEAPA